MNKKYWVYVLTCKNITLFYVGVTDDLIRRTFQHKNKLIEGYSARYNLNRLVYFEEYLDPETAILREKQLKKFSQKKKLELIQSFNPNIKDLYDDLVAG